MDLEKLEAVVRSVIKRGNKGALEALESREAAIGELAWAAGTLASRLDMIAADPDDPTRPWI